MTYLKRVCFLSFLLYVSATPALAAANGLSLEVDSEYARKQARTTEAIKEVIREGWRCMIDPTTKAPAFCAPPMAKEELPPSLVEWLDLPAATGSKLSNYKKMWEKKRMDAHAAEGVLLCLAGNCMAVDIVEPLLEIDRIREWLLPHVNKPALFPFINFTLCIAYREDKARLAYLLYQLSPELPFMLLNGKMLPYEVIVERCYEICDSDATDGFLKLETQQLLYWLDPSRHKYATRGEFYFSKLYLQTLVEAGFLDKLLKLGLVVYEKELQQSKQSVYYQVLASFDKGRVEKIVASWARKAGLKRSFPRDPLGIIASYVRLGLPTGALSPGPAADERFGKGEFVEFGKK